jgi:hypothetical protein
MAASCSRKFRHLDAQQNPSFKASQDAYEDVVQLYALAALAALFLSGLR